MTGWNRSLPCAVAPPELWKSFVVVLQRGRACGADDWRVRERHLPEPTPKDHDYEWMPPAPAASHPPRRLYNRHEMEQHPRNDRQDKPEEMKYSNEEIAQLNFSDWPVPDKFLTEFGRVAALWACLESFLNICLGKLAGFNDLAR